MVLCPVGVKTRPRGTSRGERADADERGRIATARHILRFAYGPWS
jgi:hypothetical protein